MADDEKIVAFEAGFMQLGFTMLPNVVLLNSRLAVGSRLLYATLAHYARQSDKAWPGQERIAVHMGVSERSIRTYLRELEEHELVKTLSRRTAAGARVSNLYRLLTPSAEMVAEVQRQILPPAPADIAASQRQDLPGKKTQVEEEAGEEESATGTAADGALFAVDPPPPSPAPAPAKPADPDEADIERVWAHYVQVFGDRLRIKELTDPRRRTLKKALKAVGGDVDVMIQAINGLQSYRKANPGGSKDVSLDAIFSTGPHESRSLTDKIEWWASQADSGNRGGSDNLAEHPAAIRDKVKRYRLLVVEMHQSPHLSGVRERGRGAMEWLKTQAHEEPIIEDDQVVGWRRLEA